MTRRFQFFFVLCCCIFLGSCACQSTGLNLSQRQCNRPTGKPGRSLLRLFLFSLGHPRRIPRAISEALGAYEKALICDPQAEYVKEKIPVLLLKMGEFRKSYGLAGQGHSGYIPTTPRTDSFWPICIYSRKRSKMPLFCITKYLKEKRIMKAFNYG